MSDAEYIMLPEEDVVYSSIRGCRGQASAKKVSLISLETGLPERWVRVIVKNLIEDYHLPIGSTTKSPYGYYIISNKKELNAVRKNLYNRGISILKRAQAYDPEKSGWVSRMIGQLELIRDQKN